MDKISKEHRSWNMSRIRRKDTKPELIVRSALHKSGYRFRLHNSSLPGSPDIVLHKFHTVIFVHGCFWHRHEGCKYAYIPKTREQFWEKKFNSNLIRDKHNLSNLLAAGWNVITIWECQTQKREVLAAELDRLLKECANH